MPPGRRPIEVRRLVRPIALLALGLAACAPDGAPGTTLAAGTVSGAVVAGPTCPVETPHQPCPDQPVVGVIIRIDDPEGTEVARVVTDSEGRYSLSLPVGSYLIVAQPHQGLMGTPDPVEVRVGADQTSIVDLIYDTGIR